MRSRGRIFISSALLGTMVFAQSNPRPAGNGVTDRRHAETDVFNLVVPAHPFDLILGRPEAGEITLTVVAYQDAECVVAYGPTARALTDVTPTQRLPARQPVSIRLTPLTSNTAYRYEFRLRTPAAPAFAAAAQGSFHTARPSGATFTFTLTADAHLDGHTRADVYLRTLANISADEPDFHLDLGNLFMTDKHRTRAEAEAQYFAERYYLGQIGRTVPVLLALGTHDGESGKDDTGPEGLAAWARTMRTRYFPNPVPDTFYLGNRATTTGQSPLQNYYAWTWGDALFVVLDPFSYTVRGRGGRDGWAWTLGQAQYQWLERTLRDSAAPFKFVFIHNLLCGDQAARGGVEVAGLNEWGGKNVDGSEGFSQHRPGWTEPVQALLVRNHVTAVFKAHDNFYARQVRDGIAYIMVPQPSFAGTDRIRDLETYGYKRGVFLGNSGHVRVTVAANRVVIAYVSAASASHVLDTVTIEPPPKN